jgi:hypothetical protein
MKILAEYSQNLKNIKTLDLGNNNIGDNGMKYLN